MNGVRTDGPEAVLINGAEESVLSALDRGAHYGDGLFETIACRHGRARFLPFHLERLTEGCHRLGIRLDAYADLRTEIKRLASECDASLIKVIVTRGIATARGYGAKGDEIATRVVLRYSWPQEDPALWTNGVAVRVANLRLGENAALAGLKHLNRLEHVLARAEWRDPQVPEAVMFSSSGQLVSGTMSNVFIVAAGLLKTPRIERCGVAGVMRRVVLQEASRAGIAREECALNADDLNRADEIFLTNARIGIWPVRALEQRTLVPGPITRELQALLRPLLEVPADESSEAASQSTQDSEGATDTASTSASATTPSATKERRRRD
jgi:4-amino-4-deoxychorismate lyase